MMRGGQGTGQSQNCLFARPVALEGPQVLEALALLLLGLPRALDLTLPCLP